MYDRKLENAFTRSYCALTIMQVVLSHLSSFEIWINLIKIQLIKIQLTSSLIISICLGRTHYIFTIEFYFNFCYRDILYIYAVA